MVRSASGQRALALIGARLEPSGTLPSFETPREARAAPQDEVRIHSNRGLVLLVGATRDDL
jgi:hypothetical protein